MRYCEERSALTDWAITVAEVLFLVLLVVAAEMASQAGLWWLAVPLVLMSIILWGLLLFAGAF